MIRLGSFNICSKAEAILSRAGDHSNCEYLGFSKSSEILSLRSLDGI